MQIKLENLLYQSNNSFSYPPPKHPLQNDFLDIPKISPITLSILSKDKYLKLCI